MSHTLFESYEINEITLKNRIIMVPMTRVRSGNKGKIPTELTAIYYA